MTAGRFLCVRGILVVGMCAIIFQLVSAMPARSDEEDTPARSSLAFKGANLCVRCHRSEQSDWVDLSTTATWRHDAHSRSHLALLSDNPRTQAMEKSLGFKAEKNKNCVACHTHSALEPLIEEETSVLHAGISCESCHGPSEAYFEKHMEKSWRFLASSEKEAFGMHDLRDPVSKARNCLSCHLGDIGSDRIITHQMYAAGHPPLTSFEIESFSNAMGSHWKRVWDKSEKIQRQAEAADYRTEGACQSQRALIGSLVALQQSALFVGDYATAAKINPKENVWPELALYDCQACHHELQIPSWRQKIGSGDLRPGRPSMVHWPRMLSGVALRQSGATTDVDSLLSPFATGLNLRPFGSPDSVAPTLEELILSIATATDALKKWNRDETLSVRESALIALLCEAGMRTGDFESARQIGWVMVLALKSTREWTENVRKAKILELTKLLSLEFPHPAYPTLSDSSLNGSSRDDPFWKTTLSVTPRVNMARVHAAFQMPPLDDTLLNSLEFLPESNDTQKEAIAPPLPVP